MKRSTHSQSYRCVFPRHPSTKRSLDRKFRNISWSSTHRDTKWPRTNSMWRVILIPDDHQYRISNVSSQTHIWKTRCFSFPVVALEKEISLSLSLSVFRIHIWWVFICVYLNEDGFTNVYNIILSIRKIALNDSRSTLIGVIKCLV